MILAAILAACGTEEPAADTGLYDECAPLVGAEADTELVFAEEQGYVGLDAEVVVIRDQAALDAAWASIAAEKPQVDFATTQVVLAVWYRGCLGEETAPRSFAERADGDGLVLRFETIVVGSCDGTTCDSGDTYSAGWTTSIADVTTCSYGETCVLPN